MRHVAQGKFLPHCEANLTQVRMGEFPEVAQGLPVNGSYVAPHVLRLAQHALDRHASTPAPVRALLLECTELPPYTGLLRASLSPRVPVWDAVSLMDLLHAGFRAPDYGWDKRSVSD